MGEPINWREVEQVARDFEAVEKEAAANLAEARRFLIGAFAEVNFARAAEQAGKAGESAARTQAAMSKLAELRAKLVTRALDAEAMSQTFDRMTEERRLLEGAGEAWIDLQSGTRSVRAVGDYRLAVEQGPLGIEWKAGIAGPSGEVEIIASGRGVSMRQAQQAADNAAMKAAERGGPPHPGVETHEGTESFTAQPAPLDWYKPRGHVESSKTTMAQLPAGAGTVRVDPMPPDSPHAGKWYWSLHPTIGGTVARPFVAGEKALPQGMAATEAEAKRAAEKAAGAEVDLQRNLGVLGGGHPPMK